MLEHSSDFEWVYRKKFMEGSITREAFWIELDSQLLRLSELSALITGNVETISVHKTGRISLGYRLPKSNLMKLYVPKNDIRTAPVSCLGIGNYEGILEELIFALSESSREFVDIGANLGFYSLGASLVNTKLIVHAFEPNPLIHSILKDNLHLNSISNVSTHQVCLGDVTKKEKFFVPSFTGSGGGSLRHLHPEEGEATEFDVEVEPLDNFSKQVKICPDMMKIDVEGSELSVISGSFDLIVSYKPTIIVELLRKWMAPFGTHPQQVLDLLVGLGYKAFAVSSNGLEKVTLIDGSTVATNFVFLWPDNKEHEQVLARFKS